MGLEAAMALASIGSVVNTAGNIHQQRQQGRQQRRLQERGDQIFEQSQQPGWLESLLRSQFNVGQDGQMQMLRATPGAGQFDTSDMFDALAPIRRRQHHEALGEHRATAPGLGQRFGSAMMRETANLTERHLQNITAQDTATQFQAFEAAQGRQLGLLQLLAGLEQGRHGLGASSLGIQAGISQPPMVSWGQPGFDIGQMLLMRQLIAGNQPQTASSPSVSSAPVRQADPILGEWA